MHLHPQGVSEEATSWAGARTEDLEAHGDPKLREQPPKAGLPAGAAHCRLAVPESMALPITGCTVPTCGGGAAGQCPALALREQGRP